MTLYRFPSEAGASPAGDDIAGTAEDVGARLRALRLPAEGLRIGREGGRVTIEGPVPDAATQERVILAAGNIRGVRLVDDRMTTGGRRPGLLDALGGLAHLPTGAANFDSAEDRVHEAEPDPGDTAFGPAGSLFHTVQPGESLAGVAQRHYGMAIEARRVVEANPGLLQAGGDTTQALPEGLVLRLPRERRLTRGPAPAGGR
jgi:phage tail protein X